MKTQNLKVDCNLNVNDYNKNYYNKNRDLELERCKKYKFPNREKINVYVKNKKKPDLNYELAHNIRVRTCQALKSQNVKKLNKTLDLIERSQSFFQKWILYQLPSDMTEENYGSVWSIHYLKQIYLMKQIRIKLLVGII